MGVGGGTSRSAVGLVGDWRGSVKVGGEGKKRIAQPLGWGKWLGFQGIE